MTSTLTRSLVALAALVFTGLGLAFFAAPVEAAHALGIDAIGLSGTTSLRADLGGLFVGLGLLCGAGAWTNKKPWLLAGAGVVGAIVVGRAVGWLAGAGLEIPALAIEVGALAALIGAAITSESKAPQPRSARPLWLSGGALAVAALAFAALMNPTVEEALFEGAASKMTSKPNTAPLADDAIRVAICGSSAPLPSAARAKPCVAVFVAGRIYVVDVGPESVENLVLWGVPLGKVDGVMLTHYHSDHIGDLGELQLQTWAGGRPAPLAVYGGPGVERVVEGFNEAYRLDQGYRTAHHGEEVMPSATWGMVAHTVELDGPPTAAKDRTGLVFDDGQLRVTAIEVDHAPISPAYAYRFDYKGRSVVVTGDLKNHPPLALAAKGADLMVSEAISTTMTQALGRGAAAAGRDGTAAIMHDIEDYHITPEQAAVIANDAGVGLLVYYHLLPAPDGFLMRRLFTNGIDAAREGDWAIAEDGSLYTLPLGSTDIHIGRID